MVGWPSDDKRSVSTGEGCVDMVVVRGAEGGVARGNQTGRRGHVGKSEEFEGDPGFGLGRGTGRPHTISVERKSNSARDWELWLLAPGGPLTP